MDSFLTPFPKNSTYKRKVKLYNISSWPDWCETDSHKPDCSGLNYQGTACHQALTFVYTFFISISHSDRSVFISEIKTYKTVCSKVIICCYFKTAQLETNESLVKHKHHFVVHSRQKVGRKPEHSVKLAKTFPVVYIIEHSVKFCFDAMMEKRSIEFSVKISNRTLKLVRLCNNLLLKLSGHNTE